MAITWMDKIGQKELDNRKEIQKIMDKYARKEQPVQPKKDNLLSKIAIKPPANNTPPLSSAKMTASKPLPPPLNNPPPPLDNNPSAWQRFIENLGRISREEPIRPADIASQGIQESAKGIVERVPYSEEITRAAQTPGVELLFGGIMGPQGIQMAKATVAPFDFTADLIKKGVNKTAASLYNKTLGESLDRMIASRGRGIPPEQFTTFQNKVYDIFVKDRTRLIEQATERMVGRQGRTVNQVSQVAREAADQTVSDIERALIPKGTQTGAMKFGGLPKPVPEANKYYVRSFEAGETGEKFVEIQAKPVKIPGYEEYDFIIHRPLYDIGGKQAESGWTISEGKTGLKILQQSESTQKAAINQAIANLERAGGKTKIDQLISDVKDISPRYPGVSPVTEPSVLERIPPRVPEVTPSAAKPSPATPQPQIEPVAPAAGGITPEQEVAQLAEQVKAKLPPPPAKPEPIKTPLERRTEIQELLSQPAKNLPAGTTKVALRSELKQIEADLVPQERKLRQQIMASVKSKSLPESQYRKIFSTTGGTRHLTDMRLPELQKVLKAVEKARPKKIGNRVVVTERTEKAIQSLRKELIHQVKFSDQAYKDAVKSLKLKTDRYVDTKNFISEREAKELIREMNRQAEIGLIENDINVADALRNEPAIQKAIGKVSGRSVKASEPYINGKPVNVSSTYDMRYYTGFLQERTGGRFYDVWERANKLHLENKREAVDIFSKVEGVEGYKAVAGSPESKDRIRRSIAAKNKWANVEAPELTPQEQAVADALEKVYARFPNDVREFRFKVNYDRYNGDAKLMKEGIGADTPKIQDAPIEDLREAIGIYESQGRDALRKYLDTKTWGVIESGYDPRMMFNPKLRLSKVKSYVVGKGHLKTREGVELPSVEQDILKDTRIYINQMLNLKLESYMKELDRIYSENADKFKDAGKVARNLELAILEMQGKTIDRTPLTDILMKVAGYGYSAIFLRPSLSFRNLFQNLAFHPDRTAFLNPANRKLTGDELAFWETYVRQNKAFKSDILLQDEIGAGRLAELVKRISYYGYSDDVNRLGSFWSSLNKAERALNTYRKDGNIDSFIRNSGLQDLTNLQQKEGLELLATDETEAIRFIAREVTNNVHFLYDRAQRAPLEMGASGRVLASLLTFSRSWGQRLYLQLKSAIGPGAKVSAASRARGWKNVIGIIAMGIVAGEIYKKITGKTVNPYNPLNILSWSPGGLPVGLTADIGTAIYHIGMAATGDKDAQARLTTEIPALGDDFIPFYSQIVGILESMTETQYVDRKWLRDFRAKFDKDYQPDESYYTKPRGILQKIQRALFGSEPETKKEEPMFKKETPEFKKQAPPVFKKGGEVPVFRK